MTDPLSIAVSAITLCSTTISVSKSIIDVVKSVRGASREIRVLIEDVSNLDLSLRAIKEVADISHSAPIHRILSRARDRLEELNHLLERVSNDATSSTRIKHIRWPHVKSKASDIRTEIREICADLNRIIVAQMAMRTSRMESYYHTQGALLNDIKALLVSQESPGPEKPDGTGGPGLSTPLPPASDLLKRSLACDGHCHCLCHSRNRLGLLGGESTYSYLGFLSVELGGLRWDNSCDRVSCKRQGDPYLKLAYYLPQWLFRRRVILLGFNTSPEGLLLKKPKMRRLVPMDSLVFQFCSEDNVEGLQELFNAGKASPDDIKGVGKEVLFAGNYVPLLCSAVRMGNMRVTEFLINAGADRQLEDGDGNDSSYYAWQYILRLRYEEEQANKFYAAAFSREVASDLCRFSRMHKAIFGFFGQDIERQIETYIAEIDFEDRDGNTPLQWALIRNDVDKVKILLRHGAKPKHNDLCEYLRRGPSDLEGMALFIEAGVDVNFIDDEECYSAFHRICSRKDLNALNYFLAHGANVNSVTLGDVANTPLTLSIRSRDSDLIMAERLLAAKAKRKGGDGLKAFAVAVAGYHQDPDRLEWLLRKKVNYIGNLASPIAISTLGPMNFQGETQWQMIEGATIIHAIAHGAHLDTLRYLTSARLQGLADVIDQKDAAGYTAQDYLWFRIHQGEQPDDGSDVEELDSEDSDEDYVPSEANDSNSGGDATIDSGSDVGSFDDSNAASHDQRVVSRENDKEDENEMLTEAFEAFLSSLKPSDCVLANDDADMEEEFFDALELFP